MPIFEPVEKGSKSCRDGFLITHPDVVIHPGIPPVPDWPLNKRGRARMSAMIAQPWVRGCGVFSRSGEYKAREAAQILADGLGLGGYTIIVMISVI